jgi:hypothetical protein
MIYRLVCPACGLTKEVSIKMGDNIPKPVCGICENQMILDPQQWKNTAFVIPPRMRAD